MAGRIGSVRPKDPKTPRAGSRPPREQCNASMLPGKDNFRHAFLETRAANQLLKARNRVNSVALDGKWRDFMSRVQPAGKPCHATSSELWFRNHCTPTLEQFAPRTRNNRSFRPLGSKLWNYESERAARRDICSRCQSESLARQHAGRDDASKKRASGALKGRRFLQGGQWVRE